MVEKISLLLNDNDITSTEAENENGVRDGDPLVEVGIKIANLGVDGIAFSHELWKQFRITEVAKRQLPPPDPSSVAEALNNLRQIMGPIYSWNSEFFTTHGSTIASRMTGISGGDFRSLMIDLINDLYDICKLYQSASFTATSIRMVRGALHGDALELFGFFSNGTV